MPGSAPRRPAAAHPVAQRQDLHQATKGRFALHSQTVQAIFRAFLGNVDATRELRKTNPRMRYPYKDKRYYPVLWPAQAVSRERGRVVLPMGRGRPSLVFRIDLPEQSGACKLVWKDGYELHVSVATEGARASPGQAQATVDLGEIHQAAVTTTTGAALVVSGRGIRSLKRRHNKALGQIARKRQRCQNGSRRIGACRLPDAKPAPASAARSGICVIRAHGR